MRASLLVVTSVLPDVLLHADSTRSILMFNNSDAINPVGIQTGVSPGDAGQFWLIPAGQTFTLDPSQSAFVPAIQSPWWITSPNGVAVVLNIFQG